MKYKLTERANPQNREMKKLYAFPVYERRVSKSELTREIMASSSLSRGNVSTVIESIIEIIPKHLLAGRSVNFGDLGSFRITFSSDGVENETDFTAAKISKMRVVFTASPELRRAVQNTKFEKVK